MCYTSWGYHILITPTILVWRLCLKMNFCLSFMRRLHLGVTIKTPLLRLCKRSKVPEYGAKFACNLVISNPVFRWESCKGSVWESVKKCSRWCSEAGTRGLQATRRCTQVKHIEKLNRHASCSTTRQKFQIGHSVSPSAWTRNSVKSWGQVASPHCYRKTDSLHSFLTSV